jgi:hypothetical protein
VFGGIFCQKDDNSIIGWKFCQTLILFLTFSHLFQIRKSFFSSACQGFIGVSLFRN